MCLGCFIAPDIDKEASAPDFRSLAGHTYESINFIARIYIPPFNVYSIQRFTELQFRLYLKFTERRVFMTSLLNPVERPIALAGRVYQALRANIRNGKFPPGQPLQEVQLAAQLGVSRTPVREALTRLASEGLVSSDGRSFVVPSLTLADVDDIYEVRSLIEPEALRHVARLAHDPAACTPIKDALEASIAAHKAGDNDAFMEANARFRTAWLSLVPNPRLVHAVEMYADHVHHLRILTLSKDKVRAVVLRGLKRIAVAITAGDEDGAASAMRDHLNEAKKAFIAAVGLEQPGDDGEKRPGKTQKASDKQ